MSGILGQSKWESLKKRRKDNRLILLYKGLKGKASVPTDDLIPKTRCCRNQHSVAFQFPIANTDVYKGSCFPPTIRDWNTLPDSLISSAEDAEDCVAKFTSLVRARDQLPNYRSWLVIVVTAFHQQTILILILTPLHSNIPFQHSTLILHSAEYTVPSVMLSGNQFSRYM